MSVQVQMQDKISETSVPWWPLSVLHFLFLSEMKDRQTFYFIFSWPVTCPFSLPPGSAMLEMDQILRSNEINFAVLAALPAVLVSIGIFALARQYALYQVAFRHLPHCGCVSFRSGIGTWQGSIWKQVFWLIRIGWSQKLAPCLKEYWEGGRCWGRQVIVHIDNCLYSFFSGFRRKWAKSGRYLSFVLDRVLIVTNSFRQVWLYQFVTRYWRYVWLGTIIVVSRKKKTKRRLDHRNFMKTLSLFPSYCYWVRLPFDAQVLK